MVEDVATSVVEEYDAEGCFRVLHEGVPQGVLVVEEAEVACEDEGGAMTACPVAYGGGDAALDAIDASVAEDWVGGVEESVHGAYHGAVGYLK